MKKLLLLAFAMSVCVLGWSKTDKLRFDPSTFEVRTLVMPDGQEVSFKAYEGIYYVSRLEDSTYQTLNIYVPTSLSKGAAVPILLRTYVGGYRAAKAQAPSATDATGRALKEGYVVCIPGSRGINSTLTKKGSAYYDGMAPNGLLDLKAAVCYLHYNDDVMPGDANYIFTDGTSAGGAMSALLGATGDNVDYASYLKKMGAAAASDAVFASICYCPITDLNHADMEYEWLYGCTNTGVRALNAAQIEVSNQLAALCPGYINSLNLVTPEGVTLTADNYNDYLKKLLMKSAERALREGIEIPKDIGITYYWEKPLTRKETQQEEKRIREGIINLDAQPEMGMPLMEIRIDFVAAIDLEKYLSYVASVTPLKTPPAFDAWGVLTDKATPENMLFGNTAGAPANFTDYSLRYRTQNPNATLSFEQMQRLVLMNPMAYIGSSDSKCAKHWYIRHGAKDRDTSFLVPINLALKLQNAGMKVDFALPWNRPHSGDYNLDDLFLWIAHTMQL